MKAGIHALVGLEDDGGSGVSTGVGDLGAV